MGPGAAPAPGNIPARCRVSGSRAAVNHRCNAPGANVFSLQPWSCLVQRLLGAAVDSGASHNIYLCPHKVDKLQSQPKDFYSG